MKYKYLVMVLGFFASTNLYAKDLNGSFVVKGVGTYSCEKFVKAAANDAPILQQYSGYVTGYVSAFNEINSETFDLLPWQRLDTFMLLVLQKCNQAPNDTVGGAVSQIARYFAPNKLSSSVQTVEIKGGRRVLNFHPQIIKQIKYELEQKEYNTEDLWLAMAKFKKDNQLQGEHPFEQLILLKLLYGKAK